MDVAINPPSGSYTAIAIGPSSPSHTARTCSDFVGEINSDAKSDLGLLGLLTDREIEVLRSLTHGINYKQISKILYISESTVKTHINNIFTKLSVNDRTQAVLYALHHGIDSLMKKPHLLKNITGEAVQK